MALPRHAIHPRCDTVSSVNSVSAIKGVLSQIRKSPAQMQSSFFKYNMAIHNTLKSKSAALLFSALEYRFQKMPHGFYKFIAPCENSFYRKGDSLSEELGVGRRTIHRALQSICTSYESKNIYYQALGELGELGAFQGKPYLSYRDNKTGQTFYLRDYKAVNSVLNGTYKSDIYVTKCPMLRETKMSHAARDKMSHADPVEPAASNAENTLSEKTLQRIPISLSLSNDNSPQAEQPKEESEILVLVEQPRVTISTIDQMLVIWKKTVCLDGEPTPKKGTVDNLAKAFIEVFSESLTKWGEFCKLVASSKYLMGETTQQFKLNLAWVAKPETIDKIINGHFTTGDKTNVIYYELDQISDPNPVVLKFKHACLDKFGKGRYISWMKNMRITLNENKEIVCVAPTSFHAKYVGDNDPLGFSYFVDQLPIAAIVFKEPNGNVVGKIASRNAN